MTTDYEKKYKEVLERAEEAVQKGCLDRNTFDEIFPELTESEDERIRKELLAVINDLVLPNEQRARFNAYLEKQKERGSLTKEEERTLQDIILHLEDEGCPTKWKDLLHDIYILPYEKQKEPHFTKRNALFDKCVANCDPEVMKKVSDEVDERLQKEQKLTPSRETILGIWELGNLWKENPEKREGLSQLEYIQKHWADKCDYLIEQKPDTRTVDDLHLLGFIYDLLASLDWRENYAMSKEECLRRLNDYRPQKPAEWSEKHIADIFEKVGLAKIVREQGNDKLTNALQDAMLELSKVENTEWSEEDERYLIWLCRIIHSRVVNKELSLAEESKLGKWIDKWINHKPQPVQKWDEFDEDCLKRAIWYVENPAPSVVKDTNLALWLKSLPMRCPKKSDNWKPSEEQMNRLISIVAALRKDNCDDMADFLAEIYHELEKL